MAKQREVSFLMLATTPEAVGVGVGPMLVGILQQVPCE